ncbi:hypothetical protein [Nocardia noduli]|uniref:hypothetical protein n=1 Tax=Nocardia noduli TaxID=2815722 RepID=UPI001C2392B2|nr:hypothetical protein [Nocardia noduli]
MGFVDYLHIARRRWAVLLAGLVLGVVLAAFQIQSTPATYSASSTMYVSMATGTSVADSYQGGLAAQQRVRSYLELVSSDAVVDRVIGQLGLRLSRDEMRGKITVDAPPATTLLTVTVTDEDPERSRVMTDEVVSQLRALVDDLETIERTAAPAARVAVVDRAERPTDPSGPQSTKTLALGILAGLVLGAGAAFVWERLDRTVRAATELASLGPILGSVTPGAESETDDLRALRARLPEQAKSVLISSIGPLPAPNVAGGLANTLAATGARVLLIDTAAGRTVVTAADVVRADVTPVVADRPLVPEGDWPVHHNGQSAPVAPVPVAATDGGEMLFENAAQRTTVLDLRKIPAKPPVGDGGSPAAPPHIAAPAHPVAPPQPVVARSGGLGALLRGETAFADAVLAPGEQSYSLLPLGDADPTTSDLLASDRFDTVLTDAEARFDHVVVAASGTDALAVAEKCDVTVAAVELPARSLDGVTADLNALTGAGATLTGLVTVPVRRRWGRRIVQVRE